MFVWSRDYELEQWIMEFVSNFEVLHCSSLAFLNGFTFGVFRRAS